MSPLVSIIIPTKNSAEFLEECLESIKKQSYKDIEIIVVDNYSTDQTKEIVEEFKKRFTPLNVQLFNQGPERSAQRNFGVRQAKGKFVLIIDSDMKLSENVIKSCVEKMTHRWFHCSRGLGTVEPNCKPSPAALIIPEESFGIGFWAKCKKLERSFYIGVDWMEAGRFFEKKTYEKAGGFDENITGGEEWDLSQRVGKFGKIDRISDFIFHNEGNLSFYKIIKKRFYYAKRFRNYTVKQENNKNTKMQVSIIKRYRLFFSKPKKLFKDPILGLGMLFMKSCEFGFGGVGYLVGRIKR